MVLPLAHPKPDAERFVAALSGRDTPSRPPLIEYLVDVTVMRPIVQDMLDRQWLAPDSVEDRQQYLDNFIAFWYRLGYDFVRLEMGLPFARKRLSAPDPAPGVTQERHWADQHHGAITSRQDYERYPWPRIEDFDFSAFEYVN